MFTGIIEDVGRIAGVETLSREGHGGGRRFTVETRFASELTVDESVAVNGACMTVVETTPTAFRFVAIEETLRKTTLGGLESGMPVNLERAMRANGRMDGHFVQGHVDATGTIDNVVEEVTDRLYTIRFDAAFSHYLIPVGSVTVDGISLTVARLEDERFTVAIIPHTLAHTNVATWAPGARVNLEFDMIGKYIARYLERRDAGR